MNAFFSQLVRRWAVDARVCIGLDSELARIPKHLTQAEPWLTQFKFNKAIVQATAGLALTYKLNRKFYPGAQGIKALINTVHMIRNEAIGVPVILDGKDADIGNTNRGAVHENFEVIGADACTVNPYLGGEALKPFLEREDKGIIVLCKTSNPGGGEFQDLDVIPDAADEKRWGIGIGDNFEPTPLKLYECVALRVAHDWNTRGNCALVVGATYPEQLKMVRKLVGNMELLLPGFGTQGADLKLAITNGVNKHNAGVILNSSSGITFASSGEDYAEVAGRKAKELNSQIASVLAKLPKAA